MALECASRLELAALKVKLYVLPCLMLWLCAMEIMLNYVLLYVHSVIFLQNVFSILFQDFCLRFIVRGSNFKTIIMTQQFETLPTPLMVEIVRRRHFPEVGIASFEPRVVAKVLINTITLSVLNCSS
jgi:hypothetical protein